MTTAQKKILEVLAKAPAFNRGGRGPEGMSGRALYNLKVAGLVEEIANPAHAPVVTFRGREYHANEWRITDIGRALLATEE